VYCQRDGRDGHFNPPQSGTASPLLAGVGPGLQPVPRGLLMEVLGLVVVLQVIHRLERVGECTDEVVDHGAGHVGLDDDAEHGDPSSIHNKNLILRFNNDRSGGIYLERSLHFSHYIVL